MKSVITILLVASVFTVTAQTEIRDNLDVSGQKRLDLDFPFADEIELITWDKNQVLIEVEVMINDGRDDDMFALTKRQTESTIYFAMDEDVWDGRQRRDNRNCWDTEINYKVYLPKALEIEAETISGNYTLAYYGKPANFKTISGDIDLTVPGENGLDFKVKTISGEVYSDLDIEYPDGTDGLRQIVGMNVRGRINDGGEFLDLETISGNIYLRKG